MGRYTLVAMLVVAAALMGCGAPAGISELARSERYQITLTLDAATVGARLVHIELRDRGGAPVPQAQVQIVASMAGMGHSSQVLTATPEAPGSYRADGALFAMPGVWQLAVVIQAGGASEIVQFQIQVRS